MRKQVEIFYSVRFRKEHATLSHEVKVKVKMVKAVEFFTENVLHPSVRLHKLSGKLKGLWSISIDRKHRILVRPMKGNTYLFISVGNHSIYEKM